MSIAKLQLDQNLVVYIENFAVNLPIKSLFYVNKRRLEHIQVGQLLKKFDGNLNY